MSEHVVIGKPEKGVRVVFRELGRDKDGRLTPSGFHNRQFTVYGLDFDKTVEAVKRALEGLTDGK